MSNHNFIDGSTYNRTITRAGNVSQGSFCPNPPATGVEYDPDVHGASAWIQGGATNYISTLATSGLTATGPTGDFTMSAWVYPVSSGTTWGRTLFRWSNWNMYRNTDGAFSWGNDGFGILGTTNNAIPLNTWTHVCVTRVSGTLRIFINGTLNASTSDSSDMNVSVLESFYVGWTDTAHNWDGYVSGVHVVIGTGQYTANFTPEVVPTAVANTKLLLKFSNAAIFDSKCKATPIVNGTITTDINTYKYGNASMSFDGVAGTYLLIPGNSNYWMGTGDFTIETWIRPSSVSGAVRGIFGINTSTNNSNGYMMSITTGGKIGIQIANSSWGTLESTTTLSTNTWYHVAMVRTGGNVKVYINGTQEITTTSGGATNFTAGNFVIGRDFENVDERFHGFMDDFRVTKGIARYTTNFTAPTTALPKK